MLVNTIRMAALSTALFSTAVWSDELADLKARNARLEATVQELTLQLAESLQERERLEAQLAEAVASAAATTTIVTDSEEEVMLEETSVSRLSEEPVSADTAASAQVSRVVNGCDVEQALAGYERSGEANKALSAWLQSSNHLTKCTTPQLQQIRSAVKWDLLGYQKEVLALIDRELAGR